MLFKNVHAGDLLTPLAYAPPTDWFAALKIVIKSVEHESIKWIDALLMRVLGSDPIAVMMFKHLLTLWKKRTSTRQ